jgi:hypothetical protein
MSGGRATVGRRKGKDLAQHAGDISATHELGHKLTNHWYVECKRYGDLKIESAMLEGVGPLATFWRVACAEATSHKKMPMLIIRQDRRETLMVVPAAHLLTPYGTSRFKHLARVARFDKLSCDVLSFTEVIAGDYKQPAPPDFPFLKPGELQRILGIKRERVRIVTKKRVRL